MVAIVGASGSGKSTLMNILGCLDHPTSGSYRIAGRETGELGPDALAALRREHFGFIFQRYHLLADLTAPCRMRMTCSPLALSSAPVGSSARMTAPPFISARAMDTRCCCPPDSWPGRCCMRSARPRRSTAQGVPRR